MHATGQSDQAILDEGDTFAKVWAQLDATYVPDQGWTLAAYQAAGLAAVATVGALTTANVAWSNASAQTDQLATAVEDTQPPASGWIQILHQGPGETAFTVLVAKLTTNFYEAGGFAPGAHSFKFIGINTGGESDASTPVVIQVT